MSVEYNSTQWSELLVFGVRYIRVFCVALNCVKVNVLLECFERLYLHG